jgi:hypothetical protein
VSSSTNAEFMLRRVMSGVTTGATDELTTKDLEQRDDRW